MDQSFSPQNLRKIWDAQTRRGRDLLYLFPSVDRAYQDWRTYRKTQSEVENGRLAIVGASLEDLKALASTTKQRAEDLLVASLTATSELLIADVEKGAFTWKLSFDRVVGGRQIHTIGNDARTYFADKHLQRVVDSLAGHRPAASRQSIVSSLSRSLDNRLPKAVIRVDVERFYESVDHRTLRQMIVSSRLMPTLQSMILQLIDEYASLTGGTRGLPTGVGLSAKLAEFYLLGVDERLRRRPDVQFYARYVDDIVMVVGTRVRPPMTSADLLQLVEDELHTLHLRSNSLKTNVVRMSNSEQLNEFEFLGYSISYSGGVQVKLTKTRSQAIKERVRRTFEAWDRSGNGNHGKHALLLARLRFLTGNTRLEHNKRNAMVGIFFSNPHITDSSTLAGLDAFLAHRSSQSPLPAHIAAKVAELSFVEGFEQRTFRRFTYKQLRAIRGAWCG